MTLKAAIACPHANYSLVLRVELADVDFVGHSLKLGDERGFCIYGPMGETLSSKGM